MCTLLMGKYAYIHNMVYCMIIMYVSSIYRDISCSELISLPPYVVLRVTSLLLSAAAIDRENNKVRNKRERERERERARGKRKVCVFICACYIQR